MKKTNSILATLLQHSSMFCDIYMTKKAVAYATAQHTLKKKRGNYDLNEGYFLYTQALMPSGLGAL